MKSVIFLTFLRHLYNSDIHSGLASCTNGWENFVTTLLGA